MLSYDPKTWFTFIFRVPKSDTARRLAPLMVGLAAYAWLIAFLELEYWKLSEDNRISNLTVIHTLLGFVISLLMVFRTNSAYDRWWEGRRLWGSLVNNSRNLALKLNSMLEPTDEASRVFFKQTIPLFASTLATHLRSEDTRMALDERLPEIGELDPARHVPNQVASLIFGRVHRMYTENRIRDGQLLALNPELQSLADICGACERIKNTPIPYSYSSFLRKFIFFYVMTLPFGYVFALGYWMIPVQVFVFYVLASLELIAEEIEDPFDGDTNDLPTRKIAESIERHVAELL
ncbi:MAG: hypothetical protein MUD08_04975 [Cytophagales bacterium]|jgi:putative membrane protein|nr:hypothetical protein [Cytophagales bacterium]